MNLDASVLDASVVIIVRNDLRVKACVESLIQQTYPRERWELIVVENASTDATPALLDTLPVRVIHEPRVGMGFARNAGWMAARSEIIAFIDADCVASPNWLGEMISAFSAPSVGVVGGRIVKEVGSSLVERAARDLVIGQQCTTQYLPMYPAPYVVTANAAFLRSALARIGGFDPQFYSCADTDACWRIAAAGYEIDAAPSALVWHANRATCRAYFRQFYRYSQFHALLFKKFRVATGRRWLFNDYPFIGLLRLVFRDVPAIITRTARHDAGREDWMRLYLNFLEYVALICGALSGSISHRVIYV
jgi:GT2 family glycosyltransferase